MQKIKGIGLVGSGIVSTLIVAGIVLNVFGISPELGELAIGGGIIIGLLLGLLGVLGVFKRVVGVRRW